MKKKLIQCAATLFLLTVSLSAIGQTNDKTLPVWVSGDGYWVAENNIYQPQQYTVRFYNNDHLLIGTRDFVGIRMNMKKKKIKILLKNMLEAELITWNKQNAAIEKDAVVKKLK